MTIWRNTLPGRGNRKCTGMFKETTEIEAGEEVERDEGRKMVEGGKPHGGEPSWITVELVFILSVIRSHWTILS